MRHRRPLIVSLAILALLVVWQLDAFAEATERAYADEPALTNEGLVLFHQVEQLLNTVPSGQNALALMQKYQVRVRFVPGDGSYYFRSSNTIVIDAVHGPERAALAFIHEMTHAQYAQEGWTADIWSDARATFVEHKVLEEAEAHLRSIETKAELQKAGLALWHVSYPLEEVYWDGFRPAIKSAAAQYDDAEVSELLAIGRDAGKQRMFDVLMNDTAGYPEYYGTDWDSKNNSVDNS